MMLFPGRWTHQFTRQLAMLLEEGVTPFAALELILLQQRGRRGRKIVQAMRCHLREGGTLSRAMSRHPRQFRAHYVRTIEWAEASGSSENLIVALRLLADDTAPRARHAGPVVDPETGYGVWRN